VCAAGYYCPSGSKVATQVACGDPAHYCPPGSPGPLPVHAGFYCDYGEVDYDRRTFLDPSHILCSTELVCEPGYYCAGGLKAACPPGTFSWRYGTKNLAECLPCAAGYYCPSTLIPQPAAPASTVWTNAPQTLAATPGLECGGDWVVCPRGTGYPQFVGGGNYSYGGSNHTRWAQAVCPPGSWCVGGVRQLCFMGTYGNGSGLSTSKCSGLCPAGFYCPLGASKPILCPDNFYSVSGAWACNECPGLSTLVALNVTITCQTSRSCCFADELQV
jgi:hypothetical protein